MRSAAIFVHGTSINSKIWNSNVQSTIREIFDCEKLDNKLELFDWSGSNNSMARTTASNELVLHLKNLTSSQELPIEKLVLVGHSHGGTILLKSIVGLRRVLKNVELTIITLNTPRVIGGEILEDKTVKHYHIYCPKDLIVPRAGFNKSGIQLAGGETKTFWGGPKGGEFSHPKDFESGKEGTTSPTFDSAIINIAYKDQYRHRGLNPKTNVVSHRGWKPKNVKMWEKVLKEAVEKNRNNSSNLPVNNQTNDQT
jgi:hypothetical protein